MAPRTAALVLVAATVLVGAIGYVVLSVVAGESTTTTNSGGCTPVHSPACTGAGRTGTGTNQLIACGSSR